MTYLLQALSRLFMLFMAVLASRIANADAPSAAWRLNDLQMIGSHNSFKQALDPPLLKMLLTLSDKAEGMDYAHLSLTKQLDLGLRVLELDLFHDPQGGLFAKPLGLEVVRQLNATPSPYDAKAMLQPGFKVMHVADIDFRSSQPTLAGALAELRAWSVANPHHLPIIVTVNLTDQAAPMPGATQPLPFDAAALDTLDRVLRKGLSTERLITPDLVRDSHITLEQAVLTKGWPILKEVRGKFLWAMDAGGDKRQAYLRNHPSLRERVMFTTPPPGSDDAAVLIMNDPLRDEARIRQMVDRGYLVRTRADAETREARTGDYRRFEAAKRSGAHVISTDYYQADPRFETDYQVRFDDKTYWRIRNTQTHQVD